MIRVIVLCVVLAFAGCASASLEKRLIAFNETRREWLTFDQIEVLMGQAINFMDITESPEPLSTRLGASPVPTAIAHRAYVQSLLPAVSQTRLTQIVTKLSEFPTRYYTSATGVEAANWIRDQFVAIGAGRAGVSARLFPHTWQQPSVIARINGQGPNANELVILGAHEDSVGTSATARAPGADDDATGIATVMETFRILVESGFKPDRTIEFMAYAAEEGGLRGSQAIATQYANQKADIRSTLQFDMTGYRRTVNAIGIIIDFTDPALTTFLRTLTTAYSGLPLVNVTCGYACSDHASWTRAGYRAAYPFESSFNDKSPFIHTANDLPSTVNWAHAAEFVKIAVGYAVELAGRVV